MPKEAVVLPGEWNLKFVALILILVTCNRNSKITAKYLHCTKHLFLLYNEASVSIFFNEIQLSPFLALTASHFSNHSFCNITKDCPIKISHVWKHTSFSSLKNKPTPKQMFCGRHSVFFPNEAYERTKKVEGNNEFLHPSTKQVNTTTQLFSVF